jgi:hypothetical protein
MAPASSASPTASFFGEDILALQKLDPNERFIPLRRLCEEIGLNAGAQARRIRANSILSAGLRMLALPGANGLRNTLCLRLDLVPLWLSGVEAERVNAVARERLLLFQRESASTLWHAFKPQGFSPEDTLLPPSHELSAAEQAYQAAMAMASLARQQMLIERQIDGARLRRDDQAAALAAAGPGIDDTQAAQLAQAVRRVATTLAARSRRNEYGGVYSGLYRQFGITSYRRMPPGRLREALEWLERWHGDLLGKPEPPPDI